MVAALLRMERMGLTPSDVAAVPQNRAEMPTFADARAPGLASAPPHSAASGMPSSARGEHSH